MPKVRYWNPQLNEVFEEWDKVQHFEAWDQVQHLDPPPNKIINDTNTDPVIVDDAAVVEDITGVDPQLNKMFEEWDEVQHFEEWDQVQHLEGGDANT